MTRFILLSTVASVAMFASGAVAQSNDTEGNLIVEGEASTSGQFLVEQGEADVDVAVPDPTVDVTQRAPEVTVEQPQPIITVAVPEPNVMVEQQAPIITIEQAQPQVTVRIPEPIVTIRIPEPEVDVATGEPAIQVDQPEPVVRFIRPEPQITIEEAQPNVTVSSAEPEINVTRSSTGEVDANVEVSQADPSVQIEQSGDANVTIDEAAAQVEVDEAESANVQVERADAEINVITEDDRFYGEESTTDRDIRVSAYNDFADMRSMDLIGVAVVGESGNEVGEIDKVIMVNDRLAFVVGVGGLLGLGERMVAVPLQDVSMEGDYIIMDSTTERDLEMMPEYDENAAEELPNDATLNEYF